MVKNLRRLACKFDLHQTEPKAKRSRKLTKSSTCVNLRQLASTCVSVWPGLYAWLVPSFLLLSVFTGSGS